MNSLQLFRKDVILRLAQQTTLILSTKQAELQLVKWRESEANLDTGFSELACKSCMEAWDILKLEIPEYTNYTLNTYPPDIKCVFTDENGATLNDKIELKSSTKNELPGSTIGIIDYNQFLIYCLRPELPTGGEYKLKYSQYGTSLIKTDTELFQDRAPRPKPHFMSMADPVQRLEYVELNKGNWIQHYANCAVNRISSAFTGRYSWQDALVKQIVDIFVKNTSIEEFIEIKRKQQESSPHAAQ